MKKVLFLLSFALLIFSCEGPMGPQGPQGENGVATWEVFDIDILASDWTPYEDADGLNLYYTCTADVPEISNWVYDYGTILVYYETINADAFGNVTRIQQILPFTRHFENTHGQLWTRTIDYDFAEGDITFYVTNSDFSIDPPGDMKFRVVLMW